MLAVGKASMAMAVAAAEGIGDTIGHVAITVVPEHAAEASRSLPKADVWPCDHPFATLRNLAAARAVGEFVASLAPRDHLLVLLSGGASAHLTWPMQGVSLENVVDISRALMTSGASIREINCVRKHVELLKGGRLAAMCRCKATVLVLSDVVGDPLDIIGSGPFAADQLSFSDAMAVVEKFGLRQSHPAITRCLEAGLSGERPETIKPMDPRLARVTHRVIGSNHLIINAAAECAAKLGLREGGRRINWEGSASELGDLMAREALSADATLPAFWIAGGEPVVNVGEVKRGSRGGPSQELALAAAIRGEGRTDWALMAYSTDGIDGPTTAAGAMVDGGTCERMRNAGVDPMLALKTHDSHAALGSSGDLLLTGASGTNLNHVAVLVRYPTG